MKSQHTLYTQQAKKSDRGQNINKTPVQKMAESLNLKVVKN